MDARPEPGIHFKQKEFAVTVANPHVKVGDPAPVEVLHNLGSLRESSLMPKESQVPCGTKRRSRLDCFLCRPCNDSAVFAKNAATYIFARDKLLNDVTSWGDIRQTAGGQQLCHIVGANDTHSPLPDSWFEKKWKGCML